MERKTTKRKQRLSSKVATAAVSVTASVAFGVGAVSLAQTTQEFDPSGFVSAYAHGADGTDKGYRANPTEADAQANRHSNDSSDKTQSASEQLLEDAFSQMPLNGESGTTAYRVSNDVPQGSERLSVDTGNAGGSAGANGATKPVDVVGPVVPNGNGVNGGDANKGGTDSNGSNGADEPSDPDNNGGNGGNGGNEKPNKPWVNPLPNDPVADKMDSNLGHNDEFVVVPVDGMDPSYNKLGVNPHIMLTPLLGDSSNSLYVGQSLDAWSVFCAIDAAYGDPADSSIIHVWTCSHAEFAYTDPANPKAGGYQYFRIVDYPDVAPNGTFAITYRYRFNGSDEWKEGTLEYTPAASRTYILSGMKNDDGSADVLQVSEAFSTTLFAPQYSSRALAKMGYVEKDQYGFVADGAPTQKMIVNWLMDGKPSYYCDVSSGRHVLEPGEIVDVPKGYSVVFRNQFIGKDFDASGASTEFLALLQTLEKVDASAVKNGVLAVPQGVEAIRAVDGGISADTIEVPRTTLYIDAFASGLQVKNAYEVAAENPAYAATADGILTSKDGTEYRAIPTGKKRIVVPASVTSVAVSSNNDLQSLVLQAETLDKMPHLDFSKLDGCCIALADGLLDDYVLANYDALEDTGVLVAKSSNSGFGYSVKNGLLCHGDELHHVIDAKVSPTDKALTVEDAHCFKAGSFAGSRAVETLILGDDKHFELEDGCFADSNVSTIICKTEEQLEYVSAHLEAAGAKEGAKAVLSETNTEGYSWTTESDGDSEFVTLLSAPKDVETFDGCLTRNDSPDDCIVPNAIASRAFANCTKLRWATLRQGTQSVGSSAFADCTNLESLYIEGTNPISVGSDAIRGCTGLRWVASRSESAVFETNENPSGCAMYAPEDAEGYNGNFYQYPADWGTLAVSEQTDDGGAVVGRVLYCDEPRYGGSWLALASDATLPREVKLPTATQEIYSGAFASISTPFTLNWGELTSLHTVDGNATNWVIRVNYKGAFQDSALEGAVRLAPDNFGPEVVSVSVNDDAFSGCAGLTSFAVASEYEARFGQMAFFGCSSLASFAMGEGELYWGEFSDCGNLREISLSGENPPRLLTYGDGLPWSFKGASPEDDVKSGLTLTVASEKMKEACIENWTYPFAGFNSGYDSMYEKVRSNLADELNRVPTHVEIVDAMSEDLLVAENHLRDMLGMEHATSPMVLSIEETATGCKFLDKGDEVQLLEVSSDAETIDIGTLIPEEYQDRSISIVSDAFEGCSNLKEVTIPASVGSIWTNAFEGCPLEKIVFPDGVNRLNYTSGAFSFTGKPLAEESTTLCIDGLGDAAESLLSEWTYWFGGSSGYYEAFSRAQSSLAVHLAREPYEYEVVASVSETALGDENMVRRMLGLPPVSQTTVLPAMFESVDGCLLKTDWDGVQLIKAPDDLETIDFNSILSDYGSVTVVRGAFDGCPNLKKIVLAGKIGAIESEAFAGCDGVEVDLADASADGAAIPELHFEWGEMFSFGSDSVHIVAPNEKSQEKYLTWWPRHAGGPYYDEPTLFDMAQSLYSWGTSLDDLNAFLNEPFLSYENALRELMRLPEAEKLEDMSSYYDAIKAFRDAGILEDAGDDASRGVNSKAEDGAQGADGAKAVNVQAQSALTGAKAAADAKVTIGTEAENGAAVAGGSSAKPAGEAGAGATSSTAPNDAPSSFSSETGNGKEQENE